MELVESIKEIFVVSNNREFLVNHQGFTTLNLHEAKQHDTYEAARGWITNHFQQWSGGFFQIEKVFHLYRGV